MFTRTLLEGLNALPDRPWSMLRGGKAINDAWLAKQLHPHGIGPRTIRLGGSVAKGYVEEDFAEVFRRYVSENELQVRLAKLSGSAGGASSLEGGQRTQDGGPRADNKGQKTKGRRDEPGEQKGDETGEAGGGEAAAA